jgi:hypothetical protein
MTTKSRLQKLEKAAGAIKPGDELVTLTFPGTDYSPWTMTAAELDALFREIAEIEKGRRLPIYSPDSVVSRPAQQNPPNPEL